MLVPFVVRLAPAALAAGLLAGEVEHVPTGARGAFGDAQQLLGWCTAAAGLPPLPPPRRTTEAVTTVDLREVTSFDKKSR